MGPKSSKNLLPRVPNKGDLLVHGFMREIYLDVVSDDICLICYKYYILPKFIYFYDHIHFHALNITSACHPQLKRNLIKTSDKSTSWNKAFDLNCYIPNIFASSPINSIINNEKDKNMKIIDNERYDAILSRAHSKTLNSGESSRSLYVFCSKKIDGNYKKYGHILLQSPTMNRGKLLNYMLYTDDKWGIIGTGGALIPIIYQLKLADIKDKKFNFSEISKEDDAEKTWGLHPGYQCKQYLTLNYMSDQERLFAVQCKQEHGAAVAGKKPPQIKIIDAKCGIYDLLTNSWKQISPFRLNTYLNDDEENFQCGLSYNPCNGNKIYLVSSLGRTAKYDFHKNGWSVLYENVDTTDMTMRFNMGPIVWSYQYTPNVLYCIGGKLQSNINKKHHHHHTNTKYVIQYKKFDIRNPKRQWIDCMDDIKQFHGLDFHSMFL